MGERKKVAVIGAGSWGTTVASLLTEQATTVLWARRPELAAALGDTHQNPDYLPGVRLPSALSATAELADAVIAADVVIMGVPSHGMRHVARDVAHLIDADVPVVSLSKGLERDTHKRMTEVLRDELPSNPIGVVTGPNLAKEIMAGQPAASVAAFPDEQIAVQIQTLLGGPSLRVYTNTDVVGCELAGVVKNVIAIGAGILEGLELGDNSRAALITRGLAEMTRLGVALGGVQQTFAGLAGIGDLIATCSSKQSRNNSVGLELGRGRSIDDILADMKMVAEGVKSAPAVLALAALHDVEMPICSAVSAVCEGERTVADALDWLMSRGSKSEHE